MRSKFLSLVLALSMIFSLSITAFAADGDTEATKISVTLQVVNEDGSNFEVKDIEVPANSSIYTLLTEYNKDAAGKELWTVAGSDYGDAWYLDSMSYGTKTYATKGKETPTDEFLDLGGEKANWYQGYGLISADPENKEYNYYYAGYAWMYDVEGDLNGQSVEDLTMNQFILSNGNVVTLNYQLQTSEWTREEPYTADSPYLPVNPPAASN